jgi:hypothetical protein
LEILNYSLENYKFHDKCIFIPYTCCSHLRKKRGRNGRRSWGRGLMDMDMDTKALALAAHRP